MSASLHGKAVRISNLEMPFINLNQVDESYRNANVLSGLRFYKQHYEITKGDQPERRSTTNGSQGRSFYFCGLRDFR